MARKKAKGITKAQVIQMATEWETKSISDFAKEFEVSINLIGSTARALNVQSDGEYCKPRMNRKETIMSALKTLREKKEVEADVV